MGIIYWRRQLEHHLTRASISQKPVHLMLHFLTNANTRKAWPSDGHGVFVHRGVVLSTTHSLCPNSSITWCPNTGSTSARGSDGSSVLRTVRTWNRFGRSSTGGSRDPCYPHVTPTFRGSAWRSGFSVTFCIRSRWGAS